MFAIAKDEANYLVLILLGGLFQSSGKSKRSFVNLMILYASYLIKERKDSCLFRLYILALICMYNVYYYQKYKHIFTFV